MDMHYVYILYSQSSEKFYVGRTNDLKRRYKEHLDKKSWTTKRIKAFELIFYEAFKNKKDAIRRERYLKTSKGKNTLRIMLKEYLE